jgi:hypothetical protein
MSGEQHNDYLWDRSGPVDPEIARLEHLLRPHGHDGRGFHGAAAAAPTRVVRSPRRRWRIAFAAAAVLGLCAIGLNAWYRHRLQWEPGRPWQVIAQRGEVKMSGADGRAAHALSLQGVLQTGADGMVRLRAARIGEIALGEGSRLRLVETRTGRHRVHLQEGRMWVRVWAPPGQFGVGVQGADVLDLGCEFTMESDAAGNGSLTVRSGWVQVDNGWDEVLVPEGATVRINGGKPPGTPHELRATSEFVAALNAIDARAMQVDPRGAEIMRLVAASRSSDAISLISLVQRNPALAEGPLFDRIVQLLPEAALVTRADLRTQGAVATGPWWDALPYPRIKRWWMQWPDALPTRENVEPLLEYDTSG